MIRINMSAVRTILLSVAVVVCAAAPSLAVAQDDSVIHRPYYQHKADRFESYTGRADVVMIGDSITDGAEWHEMFPGISIVNRGISGDTARGLLNRLQGIVQTSADKAFVMIGINDFARERSVDEVFGNYQQLIVALRSAGMTPHIQATLYAGLDRTHLNPSVAELNQRLSDFADEQEIAYLDLNPVLAPDGMLLQTYSLDQLHLNAAGYAVWQQALRPYLDSTPDPEFGLIYNDDGWSAYTGDSPSESAAYLSKMISDLPSFGIRTLMYCTGVSDVLSYPTEIASPFGWNGLQQKKYDDFKTMLDAGIDPIMVAGEAAADVGLNFFVSYRMNDNHFISRPDLRSEFYIANRDLPGFLVGESPYPKSDIDFGQMPSFANDKVRNFRLAVIMEHIQRYAEVMTGLELDFSRLAIMFPDNSGWRHRQLITDLVAATKAELDRHGSRLDKKLYLAIRIPPSRANSEWAGIDVLGLMERELVDLVIPSQNMTTVMDMPIYDLIAAGDKHQVSVYAGVYQRTAWTFPFKAAPSSQHYAEKPSRDMSAPLMRAAANNYRQMGADNFQLFNILLPFDRDDRALIAAVADETKRYSDDRVYAVTPSYWFDYGPEKISYRKDIPATLENGEAQTFRLYVGEDVHETQPEYVGLRIGFHGKADKIDRLQLTINHQELYNARPTMLKVERPKSDENSPPAVTHYFQIRITDFDMLRAGENRVSITVDGRSNKPITVSELQLGFINQSN